MAPVDETASTQLDANMNPPIRHDMIETAVRFMLGPKVRHTPLTEQQNFLRSKGLTEEEISLAVSRVETELARLSNNNSGNIGQPAQIQYVPMRTPWRDAANVLLVVGGGGYAFYQFLRQYILPRFFDVPSHEDQKWQRLEEQISELKDSIKFVMDSVQQTLEATRTQQRDNFDVDDTKRQLQELKQEVAIVKSLMLSRSQFAPLPNLTTTPTVPDWQRPKQVTPSSDKATPQTNGHHNDSDKLSDDSGAADGSMNDERTTPV